MCEGTSEMKGRRWRIRGCKLVSLVSKRFTVIVLPRRLQRRQTRAESKLPRLLYSSAKAERGVPLMQDILSLKVPYRGYIQHIIPSFCLSRKFSMRIYGASKQRPRPSRRDLRKSTEALFTRPRRQD